MFSILNRALSWTITSSGNKFYPKKRSRLIKALDNRFHVKFMQLEIGLLCNYLRLSSPYRRITLTLYTPLPCLDFILHLCVFTLYSHHYFITATIYWMVFTPVYLSFRLCILFFYCTLSDIFLSISVSPPFNFPLLCLSIAYVCSLSFLILQTHHFILSLLFSKYFFLITIPDEGLSPKRCIIKFFSLKLHISHLDH